MKKTKLILLLILPVVSPVERRGAKRQYQHQLARLDHPAVVADGLLNMALQQNATILKAKSDLEASTAWWCRRAPSRCRQVQATGQYKDTERNAIENLQLPGSPSTSAAAPKLERGRANRPIHLRRRETGRRRSRRPATKKQALAQYQTVVRTRCSPRAWRITTCCWRRSKSPCMRPRSICLQKELEDQQTPLQRRHGAAFQRAARRGRRGQRAPGS